MEDIWLDVNGRLNGRRRTDVLEVCGTSESGVNDERSDKKGRRCRIVVVVT